MHVVFFTSDDQTFAIPTRCIVEVIPAVRWRPLPGSESWVKGLFNYRATLLPLLDFDGLLGRNERPLHRTARILVVRSAHSQSTEAQSAKLGLLVQRVLGSEQLEIDQEIACADETPPNHTADLQQQSERTPSTGEPLGTPPSEKAAATIPPMGSRNLQSFLGPVVLTSTGGTVQLIRADGIPAPELS